MAFSPIKNSVASFKNFGLWINRMMNFQLSTQLFAIFVLLPKGFCQSFWSVTRASEKNPKYEVLVEKTLNDSVVQYCAGVILNDRYVLTIYSCTRDHNQYFPAKEHKIYVGAVNYGLSFKVTRNAPSNWEYEVENIWPGEYDETFAPLRFLTLLRTKNPIQYSSSVRCISLPKDYYIVWKYSFTIPNNVEVTSSLWCLDTDKNHALFIRKGIRNCSKEVIYNTPNWLVATCIEHKKDNIIEDCVWPRGIALVYNNTLVGMRNYRKERSGPPFTSIKSELFINVAKYVKKLEKQMTDYQPCSV